MILVIQRTQSGQLILNDTFGQLAVTEIPFGGQGESGCQSRIVWMSVDCTNVRAILADGSYLGKFSFDNFIHKRGSINVPMDQG